MSQEATPQTLHTTVDVDQATDDAHRQNLQALFDDVLAEATETTTKLEVVKKKKERLSQILAFKKANVEKQKQKCEQARREAQRVRDAAAGYVASIPTTPSDKPGSGSYAPPSPVCAPSPLKRASTALDFIIPPKKALSPEQKDRLKHAKHHLIGQVGSPRNFVHAPTELIFTEDDQPVLVELKSSPAKKNSLSKRKRAAQRPQQLADVKADGELATGNAVLVNCQFPILQRGQNLSESYVSTNLFFCSQPPSLFGG